MPILLKPSLAVFSLFIGLAALDASLPPSKRPHTNTVTMSTSCSQTAIPLDRSPNLNELIDQAKTQLWNRVRVAGKTMHHDTITPCCQKQIGQ